MRYLSANQFDVFEEIGKGGFGVVYRGIDKVTKIEVAIKQIDLETTDNIEDLQREIKILSLCRLNQITRYHGCFVKGHKLWIIMEYLDGGSCMDLLAPGPIKEKYIAVLLKELLHALCYLHENSRIHRDIKAANILLNKKGDVKIADFGVSTQLSNNLSRRNTFVGSPYWMSPEVILEEEYNFKADIWSLGITAIELATGKPPLSHIPPMKVLFQIPERSPPRLEGDQFSDDFKDFVAMCLQINPNNRPSAKRLLKSRFISWAGRKTILSDLIRRNQIWELQNESKIKKQKRHYVPTISDELDSKNKENQIMFDFDDDQENKDKPASEVIITKRSPLKYSPRGSTLKSPLRQNDNTFNMTRPKQLMEPLVVPKKKTPKIEPHPPLTKTDITRAFQQTLATLDCQDDVQMVKLEHIHLLLQELDESVLVPFTKKFHQHLETPKASPLKESIMTSHTPKSYTTNTISQYKAKSDPAVSNMAADQKPRMGPRKAESEKLLLKRWADQYFT